MQDSLEMRSEARKPTPTLAAMIERAPTATKEQQWFRAGAEAFALLFPDAAADVDVYVCPLCKMGYTIEDLLETKRLTREHVPPKSIGGRHMVLTCKPCNERSGSTFDAHLERAEAARRFGSSEPLRPLSATMVTGGIPNRGSIDYGAAGLTMVGVPKQNDPAVTDRLVELLPELLVEGEQIQVTINERFNLRTAALGFVRAAYLAAFATFGYAYIFRPTIEPIRALLTGADDETVYLPVLNATGGDASTRVIGVLSEPTWLSGAVIVVIGQVAVLLPNLETAGDTWGYLAERHRTNPADLYGPFKTSGDVDWPTGPTHAYDRWFVDQRNQHGRFRSNRP